MSEQVFYVSSNGDQWLLVGPPGTSQVEHRANSASGGAVSRIDVKTFMEGDRDSPERKALRDILAKTARSDQRRSPGQDADTSSADDRRSGISVVDEVERMGDEIEDRPGPHSDPAY